jgi:8-oxo-dGTP diphosphatase
MAQLFGSPATVEVAIAILYQDNQFLLQLRDDNPAILYPGYWAFCGGHLEPGEDADTAIRRELLEEIAHVPAGLTLFERSTTTGPEKTIIRNFYQAALEVPVSSLAVNEGQELGLASLEEIQRGDRYSQVLRETRPIGPPHQAMLLKFIAAQAIV